MFPAIAILILSQVYVSAADEDCAKIVYATPSWWGLKGEYHLAEGSGRVFPLYLDGLWAIYVPDPVLNVTFGQMSLDDGRTDLFYLSPTPEYLTCFPYGLDEDYRVANVTTGEVFGTVHLHTYPKCEPCKQVLDGPDAGNYSLYSSIDDRCNDGCLYSNDIDDRFFCFEKGSNQVLLECPFVTFPFFG